MYSPRRELRSRVRARQMAAKLIEPKVQFISLDRGVLKTETEVDAYRGRSGAGGEERRGGRVQ